MKGATARALPLVAVTAVLAGGCGGSDGSGTAGEGKLADGKTFTLAYASDPGALEDPPRRSSPTRAARTPAICSPPCQVAA